MASRTKIVIILVGILCGVILPFPLLAVGIRWDFSHQGGSMTNILPGTGLVLGMILMVSLPRQVAWKIGLVVLYLVGMGMGLFIFGAEFVCSEYRSCM